MFEEYPDVLTPAEVAQILRVSLNTVYKYVDSGAIYGFRLKATDGRPLRKLFIPKKGVIAYLEGTS